jgi:signal transduction histidine kinase
MKRMWLAWLVFGLCAGAMLAIMSWGTRKLVQLDATEKRAKQEAALEESVRLSLWRMETALAAIVVQENSRPYTAYTPSPDAVGPATPPYVKLHFQVEQDGRLAPASASAIEALRNSASSGALSAAIPRTWIHVERSEESRADTRFFAANEGKASAKPPTPPNMQAPGNPAETAGSKAASQTVSQAEPLQQVIGGQPGKAVQTSAAQSQMARNVQEFEARGTLNSNNPFALDQRAPLSQANPLTPPKRLADPSIIEIRTGSLAPVWVGDDLILARHVQVGSREIVQGCWIDWLKVRSALLASITDLLPGSDLIPERGRFDPAEGRTLASLPLRLVPGRVQGAVAEEGSPMLFSLKIAWGCMAVAIFSVGALLMGAISLSQRRAAFVSSVTHELRTPLTTFRMYTEMLVEGMATDPAKQSQYHQTLYRESDRLVHLVENVLSYARLERGKYGDRETIPVIGLIDRPRERLTEHARLANMELLVSIVPGTGSKIVSVDASAIERILFNLVDNACKYARPATDRRIHLDVKIEGRWVQITVRDHGPGIDRRRVKRLFKPFRKTANEAARSAPGVGIGLPLSRRLARAAGGRLVVVDSNDGACLRLDLPLVPPTGG